MANWGVPKMRGSRLTMGIALLSLFALVSGLSNAGRRYFYCGAMQELAFEHCCAGDEGARSGASDDPASVSVADESCCEVRTFRSPPAGALGPTVQVAAAPLATLAPPIPLPVRVTPPALTPAPGQPFAPGLNRPAKRAPDSKCSCADPAALVVPQVGLAALGRRRARGDDKDRIAQLGSHPRSLEC